MDNDLTAPPSFAGKWSTAEISTDPRVGFLLALVILPARCEARATSARSALARLVIGNCHYEESADGAAVTDRPRVPEPAVAP